MNYELRASQTAEVSFSRLGPCIVCLIFFQKINFKKSYRKYSLFGYCDSLLYTLCNIYFRIFGIIILFKKNVYFQ